MYQINCRKRKIDIFCLTFLPIRSCPWNCLGSWQALANAIEYVAMLATVNASPSSSCCWRATESGSWCCHSLAKSSISNCFALNSLSKRPPVFVISMATIACAVSVPVPHPQSLSRCSVNQSMACCNPADGHRLTFNKNLPIIFVNNNNIQHR